MNSGSSSFKEGDSLTDEVVQFIGVGLDVLLFEVLAEFFAFASFGG